MLRSERDREAAVAWPQRVALACDLEKLAAVSGRDVGDEAHRSTRRKPAFELDPRRRLARCTRAWPAARTCLGTFPGAVQERTRAADAGRAARSCSVLQTVAQIEQQTSRADERAARHAPQ